MLTDSRPGADFAVCLPLQRIIFLESIAGVPGMVAGAIRHLHSLRLLRRDGGWIRTLLEEAENERYVFPSFIQATAACPLTEIPCAIGSMHLMTFMAVARPSRPLRALILVGQGVFYNLFFLSYLFAPKVAHRFVGCLEEEAVVTCRFFASQLSFKPSIQDDIRLTNLLVLTCRHAGYWRAPGRSPSALGEDVSGRLRLAAAK